MARLDHQRARAIFDAALELLPERRDAFVVEQSAGDERLLRHLRRLLAADVTSAGFLEKPASLVGPLPVAEAYLGARVGRYTLTGLLGWGGMGRVYETRQDEPRRTVALKIIGALPTPESRRRFRYECEVLARLHHPGIAQIYESFAHPDPLTGEELPCFAMELIRAATPLTRFAADRRLDLRARVELFLQACDAIHHAHQRAVIHRDIKPANLLVSDEGRVKVIDFGIARAEGPGHTRVTRTGQLMGTLAYMSPEQCAAGEGVPLALGRAGAAGTPQPSWDDVDLRSDVYSLGVVLYELLAGRLPYDVDTASALEAARIIREAPPLRLRHTRAGDAALHIPADLEAVTFKALAKDRAGRYQSADALAADLRRYLAGEPVTARPPSPLRQLRYAWRRHRALGTALAAVFAALVLGVAGTATGLMRVTAARNDAQAARLEAVQRLRAAEQTSAFLVDVLAAANPFQLSAFAPLIEPESMLGVSAFTPAPAPAPGTEPAPASPTYLRSTSSAPDAAFAGRPGRGATAYELLLFAAARLDTSLTADPLARARAQASLGQIMVQCGLLAEGGELLARAHDTLRAALGPADLETARAAEWRALAAEQFAANERCVELRQEALGARRALQGETHPATVRAAAALARTTALVGRHADALALQRANLALVERALGPDAPLTLEQRAALGVVLLAAGRSDDARAELDAALAALAARDLADSAVGAWTRVHLAQALRLSGRFDEAEHHARLAFDTAARFPGNPDAAGLGPFKSELALCLVGQRRWSEAAAVMSDQMAQSTQINGPEHHATLKLMGRVGYLLVREAADPRRAAALLADASRGTRALGPGESWRVQMYEAVRAEALRLSGSPREALELLRALRAERLAALRAASPDTANPSAPDPAEPADGIRALIDLMEARALLDADPANAPAARALLTRSAQTMREQGNDSRRSLQYDAADAEESLARLAPN